VVLARPAWRGAGRRVFLAVGRGRPAVLALHDRPGLRARWRDHDAGIIATLVDHRAAHCATTLTAFSVSCRARASSATTSSISPSVMMNGGATSTRSPLTPSA